ncbi:protein HYPER-SENSITIVITY-RELATED 4 isoform X2 [Jatropha curcas]|uniref:protein HYPER-SENSITIVITY-RELATED 4 isoform X2 n=1 Tax=Jatropha curcas TaxID=180498 RepID=UPI0009D74369|nr:protein HYPER-SENSITIVITY-RELATED 4 isoform X2 [Jatropha curcas]
MASSSTETNLATAKTVLSTAASVAATFMLARSVAQDILPHEFHYYFFSNVRKFFNRFSPQITMVIDEFDGFVHNQMYEAAETYLGSKISPSTQRFKVSKSEKENNFTVKVEGNEEIIDIFQGVKFKWVFVCRQVESRNYYHPFDHNSSLRSEERYFEVSFPKKQKDMVLESYLHYIVKEAKSIVQEKKTLKIFTVDYQHMYGNLADAWKPVNLDHPATLETIALETELKDRILKDLERFVKRKDYYRKVGKAWKRGYLLYGPPGTGKSSLIAAIANYLNFDIYDLELTELHSNSDLRKLLISTANRSILVVEDIDCSIELQDRLAEASEARHSHSFPPQKQIEEFISTTQVTPAEVAEQLMRSDEIETVLVELIQFLKVKKKENEEDKAKESEIVVAKEQEHTVEKDDDDN